MAVITIREVKEYLRIEEDFTQEDNLLNNLVMAADQYLKTGVGTEIYEKIIVNEGKLSQAKIYCLALITEWYENRNFIGSITEGTSLVLQILATQLKYS